MGRNIVAAISVGPAAPTAWSMMDLHALDMSATIPAVRRHSAMLGTWPCRSNGTISVAKPSAGLLWRRRPEGTETHPLLRLLQIEPILAIAVDRSGPCGREMRQIRIGDWQTLSAQLGYHRLGVDGHPGHDHVCDQGQATRLVGMVIGMMVADLALIGEEDELAHPLSRSPLLSWPLIRHRSPLLCKMRTMKSVLMRRP